MAADAVVFCAAPGNPWQDLPVADELVVVAGCDGVKVERDFSEGLGQSFPVRSMGERRESLLIAAIGKTIRHSSTIAPSTSLNASVVYSSQGPEAFFAGHVAALTELGGVPVGEIRYDNLSIGSGWDSYDCALAESIIGFYKTELITKHDPWRGPDLVEHAALEWVDWYNNRRRHRQFGHLPPTEIEDNHHHQYQPTTARAVN